MVGKELVVPDWLKAKIDQGEVRADADKVISAVESVPRISLKSRRFNFIENGEVVIKTADPIHVVIVGVQPEHGMAKTYYEGSYEPGDSSPPDCSSFDGVRPDNWITSPISETCHSCSMNKWGSAKAMSGGKAKACRDSKRLIVVNAKNIQKGTEFTLNVTVASLKNLSNYGKELAKKGIPLEAVITTISIDEDADWAMLHFNSAGVLNEEQGTLALKRASERAWEDSGPVLEHQTESAGALPPPQPEAPAVQPETVTAKPAAEDEDMDALLGSW
jgi:hypothetical protein